MADLATFLTGMLRDGTFARVVNNSAAQFGPQGRPLLGATLLPERTVPNNEFIESAIQYQTLIANDGTRYSPAQLRPNGMLMGEFRVSLGHQDIAKQFTSEDYDALLRHLENNASLTAEAALIGYTDLQIVRPLAQRMEVQRWQAIVDASVVRKGDNGYLETVTYPNPTGHRVTAGGTWSNDLYDPYDDILAMVQLLSDKGFTVNRIITSRKNLTILTRNAKIAARSGKVKVVGTTYYQGRASYAEVGAMLQEDGLPAFEIYDEKYQDTSGFYRYLPEDAVVFASTTAVDVTVPMPDGTFRILPDTIGYEAVGRPAGQQTPGRALSTIAYGNKPPRIEFNGWQTTLPVISQPESIAILRGIA